MKKLTISAMVVAALFCVGCQTDMTQDVAELGDTLLNVTLPDSDARTSLGEKNGTSYPIYWSEGDKIVVDGVESKAVVIDSSDARRATFSLNGVLTPPFLVTYPYTPTTTADSPKVDFPAEQNYIAGSFDLGAAPMCGYIEQGNSVSLKHLAGVLCFALRGKDNATVLKSITITSEKELSGVFDVNCQTATITATSASTKSVTYTLPDNFTLSTSADKLVYITLPYGDRGRCQIAFTDSNNKSIYAKFNASDIKVGKVHKYPSIVIKETNVETNLDVMYEEEVPDWNFGQNAPIQGYVKCNGTPLKDVVVSDGFISTKTNSSGFYALNSELTDVKFVMVSIPSGYTAPVDSNGLPIFYQRLSSLKQTNGSYTANFTLNKISGNADRFTLLVGADPQPRASSAGYDRNAYHSLDCCEDLYRDMKEKAATITDRNVYGLMLGDIVHENMDLYDNYIAGLSTLGFPMFNVIGNHDNDPDSTTDVEGRHVFEEKLGPTYYSFNIGKLHFVVLDNLIMFLNDGELTGYEQGLTDEIWQWLQSDLHYVDESTTLMIAAHSPMTKLRTGGSRTDAAKHFADYATLFAKYKAAHIWTGHTHNTYNYNYPVGSALHGIEEHTVARSTGELWTNEYLADGTPRGYVVVEVDGDDISWKFKPTIYQTGSFTPAQYTPTQPNYIYRDWDYDSNGVAKMRSNGATLSESYQMKVYAPGTYHDNFTSLMADGAKNNYIYVNVFLWDDKWGVPTFNGSAMENVAYNTGNYSLASHELRAHYKAYGYKMIDEPEYGPKEDKLHTLFRIKAPSASGSGTVSVTDRFGNTYSSTISW
ncbi:MAG: hypothetical protein E7147_06110 [Rikenellaceae bacterium]|nr:hypothetical protein [Rikenellaceae bacterium]